jgi:hypothetical protein
MTRKLPQNLTQTSIIALEVVEEEEDDTVLVALMKEATTTMKGESNLVLI